MKHLTYDDRLQIQKALTVKDSFTSIAEKIGKNRTTVSREIQSYLKSEGKPSRSKCVYTCIFKNKEECPVPICTKRECSVACAQCAKYCDKYEPHICKKLKRPPYVCNGCDERATCYYEKFLYDAEYAHKEYKKNLSVSREGITLSDDELKLIAENVIPLVKNGVSVSVAYDSVADCMPVSSRTVYSYIDKGIFDVDNLDLRRKVRRKPNRRKSGPGLRVDKNCHIGRTYDDFERFLEEHPGVNVCEMDSVEGTKGGKVILTIFFRDCDLQLMYLRDGNTSSSVTAVFSSLRKMLNDDFKRIFPLILTDRGTEFSNPDALEINECTGEIETHVFYCDPQQTNQKSRCERNHEYIRYIIPKGNTLNNYVQSDIDKVMNNVNSMPRGSLNARTPVDVFVEIYGEKAANKLGLKKIPINELCLKPELLTK